MKTRLTRYPFALCKYGPRYTLARVIGMNKEGANFRRF
jgi:hypothetical protein